MATRYAIVGDVHGAIGPLDALLEALVLSAGDHLVFVGDLVDKGPDSAGVVKRVRQLSETAAFKVTLIEGNHEDRHRRYYRNKTERPGVARSMAARSDDFVELDRQLSPKDRQFLERAQPFLRIPEWNILVVHGGIPGTMTTLPASLEVAAALRGKARSSFRQVLRTRYVSGETGTFRSYGEEGPGDVFWAEVYDGRFGHVVFGHQPFRGGVAAFPHATGVDTGAIHGGYLSALVLPKQGHADVVQVEGELHLRFCEDLVPARPSGRLNLARLAA